VRKVDLRRPRKGKSSRRNANMRKKSGTFSDVADPEMLAFSALR
jgi:hypothetical protein